MKAAKSPISPPEVKDSYDDTNGLIRRAETGHMAEGVSPVQALGGSRHRSKRAVGPRPDNAMYHNSLAWLLATCPGPLCRNESLAVSHAERAIELSPITPEAWNTLGGARYRAGEWQSAIDILTKAEELEPGTYFGHNAFFLAMAYWRLGQEATSLNWFDQAIAWLAKSNPAPCEREELERFRAEAEELQKAGQ